MKKILTLAALAAVFHFSSPAFSAVFTPQNAGELRDALEAAGSNGDDSDTINLGATTYHTSDIGGPFTFTSVNFANSLTIVGAGIGQTILDGDQANPVMHLQMQSNNSQITVQGITFQNGKGNGGPAGLDLSSSEGDTIVENCEFKNNVKG